MLRWNRMQIVKLCFQSNNFGSGVCVLTPVISLESATWQKVNELTKPHSKAHKYISDKKIKANLTLE